MFFYPSFVPCTHETGGRVLGRSHVEVVEDRWVPHFLQRRSYPYLCCRLGSGGLSDIACLPEPSLQSSSFNSLLFEPVCSPDSVLRLASNFWSSCLHLPHAGITNVCHHSLILETGLSMWPRLVLNLRFPCATMPNTVPLMPPKQRVFLGIGCFIVRSSWIRGLCVGSCHLGDVLGGEKSAPKSHSSCWRLGEN